MAPEGDRELVATFLARRDEAAFRALYRRHAAALYLLALRLLGGLAREAEDVVQDTWIRAAERLPAFRWESSFRTWLSGIAVNRCREVRRELSRELPSPEPDIEESTATPFALPAKRVDAVDLERAIRSLPDGYRRVLVLHDVEGRTHEEIGRLLEIDAGTSKSQLFRARMRLRAWLERAPAGRQT